MNKKCEKLLGVKFNYKLTFTSHVSDIIKVAPYFIISKRILMNAFFTSQFNYCSLVWMCHNRTNNMKINRHHERCLRIIYNDKTSSFENLLENDGSVSIHNRNFQVLDTEIFKINRGISPSIVKDIYKQKAEHPYNLRCISQLSAPWVNTPFHGRKSISFLGTKIWKKF